MQVPTLSSTWLLQNLSKHYRAQRSLALQIASYELSVCKKAVVLLLVQTFPGSRQSAPEKATVNHTVLSSDCMPTSISENSFLIAIKNIQGKCYDINANDICKEDEYLVWICIKNIYSIY